MPKRKRGKRKPDSPKRIGIRDIKRDYNRRARAGELEPDHDYWRPKTRADCSQVPRPCPYVSCKYNLYLDVEKDGSIVLNHPNIEPHEMKRSCLLDILEETEQPGHRKKERAGFTSGANSFIPNSHNRVAEKLGLKSHQHAEITERRALAKARRYIENSDLIKEDLL